MEWSYAELYHQCLRRAWQGIVTVLMPKIIQKWKVVWEWEMTCPKSLSKARQSKIQKQGLSWPWSLWYFTILAQRRKLRMGRKMTEARPGPRSPGSPKKPGWAWAKEFCCVPVGWALPASPVASAPLRVPLLLPQFPVSFSSGSVHIGAWGPGDPRPYIPSLGRLQQAPSPLCSEREVLEQGILTLLMSWTPLAIWWSPWTPSECIFKS